MLIYLVINNTILPLVDSTIIPVLSMRYLIYTYGPYTANEESVNNSKYKQITEKMFNEV